MALVLAGMPAEQPASPAVLRNPEFQSRTGHDLRPLRRNGQSPALSASAAAVGNKIKRSRQPALRPLLMTPSRPRLPSRVSLDPIEARDLAEQ